MLFLKRGYHWEWNGDPPLLKMPILKEQSLQIQEQVLALLNQDAIYEVEQQPCVLSRIFVIPKQPSGSRLILDVSSLNRYLVIPSFKMTNHRSLSSLMQTPCWMASLDLKDAYLHVPMRQNLHKFLALTCWNRLYFFRALPFGLAPAPWLFSTLMSHALEHLREEGIQVLGYIDDLVFWHQDKEVLTSHLNRAVWFLERLGMTINWKKSKPSPVSSLTWVGICWESQLSTWCPQTKLLEEIQDLALQLEVVPKASRRSWERLVGLAAFAAQVSKRARHHLHALSRLGLFDHETERDRLIVLPRPLKQELPLWTKIKTWLLPESFLSLPIANQCWTDASTHGWGILGEEGETFQGEWSKSERRLHINVLETMTILKALNLLGREDSRLVVWTDSKVAISVVNKLGSHSPDLQQVASSILQDSIRLNVQLMPRHIEGRLNVAADVLSRNQVLEAEWEIPQEDFNNLQASHGKPLQVDLFASPLNCKLETFVSPFEHPQALAADALTLEWNRFQQIYLFPPLELSLKVAEKLHTYKGGGVLVLKDNPHFRTHFPTRCLATSLPTVTPCQSVQGVVKWQSAISEPYRAWSF